MEQHKKEKQKKEANTTRINTVDKTQDDEQVEGDRSYYEEQQEYY